MRRALPEADVVVHVEPQAAEEAEIRERAQDAALHVPSVREMHNVNVLTVDGRTEISLHLKLPGTLSLDQAHAVAEQVERTILDAVPEAAAVRTHLEPLAEAAEGWRPSAGDVEQDAESVLRIVREETGAPPRGAARARDGATGCSSSSRWGSTRAPSSRERIARRARWRSGSAASARTSPTSTCTRSPERSRHRVRPCSSACSARRTATSREAGRAASRATA